MPDHFLQYTVMPFVLRNVPTTFQRLMSTVLWGVSDCEVYLDDIVAYSSTWTKHVLTLRAIFDRLCAASLTLNLAKCEFRKAVIAYPGKQVWQGQICLVRVKVQAIVDFPALKMCRQLCRFLGMVGCYGAICKDFSEVVAPLACLASPKTQSQKWQVAF